NEPDRACFWTSSGEVVDLKQYLIGAGVDLQGYDPQVATEVSANGRFIVGYGRNAAGNLEGFRVGLPPAACNLADITEIGGTTESQGSPDQQLTVDDIIVFINLFGDATGCPGSGPCNRADVTGIGGPPVAPDGQLTVDDIIGFFNAFGDGCPG
ncbi:MAG: hypothetical protein K2V38_02475, partial [Gemmataceae bacterium]|nr:hypothetical protein [Gemmataceae bacterium]